MVIAIECYGVNFFRPLNSKSFPDRRQESHHYITRTQILFYIQIYSVIWSSGKRVGTFWGK
jgi:hypothetical protein